MQSSGCTEIIMHLYLSVCLCDVLVFMACTMCIQHHLTSPLFMDLIKQMFRFQPFSWALIILFCLKFMWRFSRCAQLHSLTLKERKRPNKCTILMIFRLLPLSILLLLLLLLHFQAICVALLETNILTKTTTSNKSVNKNPITEWNKGNRKINGVCMGHGREQCGSQNKLNKSNEEGDANFLAKQS